ncbi:CAP domain-containing protein [Oceanomicrobium pacificus]|uniref:CAP domain-containing protein n=1 Tax=Oceanomicrobium pacificus TaxID=2692916 RepID=A0A6B0TLA6_9RHOB|nr:CAP domain-containing protein [Oceanomicrobium pacificus]MXU64666.1 CAP domain-containing protein [Oceanomicrobium pacificus]
MFLIRAFLIASALILSACASGTGGGMISGAQTDSIRIKMQDSVNALRSASGLTPLTYSAALNAAAATHARDMSVQQRAWHFGSDRTSPQDRATRAGYPGLIRGEVISESSDAVLTLLESWMATSTTRNIIMDPAGNAMGFSWFQESNGKIWWVMMVGG